MEGSENQTGELQTLLDRWGAGAVATATLFERADARFRSLARKMLRGYPAVRRKEQTDDVWHGASLRMVRALAAARPTTVRALTGLAAEQIRRELLDLARKHRRRPAATNGDLYHVDGSRLDHDLDRWAALHEAAGRLPEPLKEVFELVYYGGLTQAEAARTIGTSDRTVRSYWKSAKLSLLEVFLE
jgi:RNA polymerase sigma-70 factor (ECF subfamily)